MKLFGTDGIRGEYGKGFFSDKENIFILGKAAASVLSRLCGHKRPSILIGRDTRESSCEIEKWLAAGFTSSGGGTVRARAVSCGVIPTPAVAWLTRTKKFSAGAVISASHNPYQDNGIKFFSSKGEKLDDKTENDIEKKWSTLSTIESRRAKVGVATEPRAFGGKFAALNSEPEEIRKSYISDYITYLLSTLPLSYKEQRTLLSGLKIAVDCANGSTSGLAGEIFTRLGAEIHIINNRPDGKNINDGCGSLHPECCAQVVKRTSAFAGMAFDGDGDRVIFIDEKGGIIDGDKIIAVCTRYLKSTGALKGRAVVATVMSNLGFIEYMRGLGVKLPLAAVGDRNVWEEMKKTGALLGGEQSGHIIFKKFSTTGDGLLTAIQFLYAIVSDKNTRGKPLSEAAGSIFEKYPQVLVNLRVRDKIPIDKIPGFKDAVRREEEILSGGKSGRGRIFVRYSGTEPILRIMVEGPDGKSIRDAANRLKEIYLKSVA